MPTCRDIVTRALRMARVLPLGEEPEAVELRDGMGVLESLYAQWLHGGMFGRLEDRQETGDVAAEAGQRVSATGAVTLPLPTREEPVFDLAAVEINDAEGRRSYVWDRVAWLRIDGLEASDPAPLADRGANGLAACLALLYAEDFGAQVGAAAVIQARAYKTALSLKLGTDQPDAGGTYW